MPTALQWNPGVVVQQNELGSPEDRDWKASAQADAENGNEALRPALRRAQGRGGPVEVPHEGPDCAPGCEYRLFEIRAHRAQAPVYGCVGKFPLAAALPLS